MVFSFHKYFSFFAKKKKIIKFDNLGIARRNGGINARFCELS